MRFLVFVILFGSWTCMWWWTYSFHIKDCTSGVRGFTSSQVVHSLKFPLGFQWGEVSPLLGDNFMPWRDSVVHALGPDQTLMVTGVAYRDEVTDHDVVHLARMRARAVSRMIEEGIPRQQLQLEAKIGVVKSDVKRKVFQGFELRTLTRNSSVRQSADCTMLYFPADTAQVIVSDAVKQFMSNFANELQGAFLITVFPRASIAESDTVSLKLEEWRLLQIRNALVKSGHSNDLVVTRVTTDTANHACAEEPVEDDRNWVILTIN